MFAYRHLMTLLTLWLVLIPCSLSLHADENRLSQIQSLSDEITALRAQYEEVELNQKTPLLNNLLVRRSDLIQNYPDHPEHIFWRLAQLEDAMIKGVRFNGLEYIVRYGLPDQTQINYLNKMLRIALEQSEAIERDLPKQISAAPEDSVLADRLTAIRNSRLPYLRGSALVIAADQGIMPVPAMARQEAIRLLGSNTMQLSAPDRSNTSRYLAEAHAGEQDMDIARQIIQRQLQLQPRMDFDTLGLILAEYEIEAMMDAESAAARGQLRASTSSEPLVRTMLIDQSAKHWMEASRQALNDLEDPDRLARHAELERSAFESFLLLQPEQGGVVIPDDQSLLDLDIERRQGRLKVHDYRADHVPVSVILAQLLPMLQDPKRVPEAHEMLVSIVDRKGLMPRVQSRLLAVTMRAEALMGRHAKGVDHAIKWSTIAASRKEAFMAATMAASMATDALREQPDNPELALAKKRAIDHLLENFTDHPDIDRWLFESGIMAQQDGDEKKALEFFESISGETPFRGYSVPRKAIGLVRSLKSSPTDANDLEKARKRLARYFAEHKQLSSKFPKNSPRGRVELNMAGAEIELMDSKPTKALEYLGRIQVRGLTPDRAVQVYQLQLDAAIQTNRPAAVEAIIAEVQDGMKPKVIYSGLFPFLLTRGERLPMDPLGESTSRDMIFFLTEELAESSPADEPHLVAIMEGYRRVREPEKAIEFSSRILAENPNLATALFSRAESLLMIPDANRAEAIELYTRLTRMDPADEPNIFWTSQLRLLQLMLEDGRGMDAIEARLNRLQRQYPDLGGVPYIGEFAIVRTGLNDAILP